MKVPQVKKFNCQSLSFKNEMMKKMRKKEVEIYNFKGCDFVIFFFLQKQSRIGAKSLWSGFVYILLFSNFVFSYKLKTLKLF